MASFDVLLQPRKKEIYAPTVHEALASGVPVVAYDSGTASDAVRHEHNGLLVDTDRGGKSFARAVARLAASPDLRFTLAAAARQSVVGAHLGRRSRRAGGRALPRRPEPRHCGHRLTAQSPVCLGAGDIPAAAPANVREC